MDYYNNLNYNDNYIDSYIKHPLYFIDKSQSNAKEQQYFRVQNSEL